VLLRYLTQDWFIWRYPIGLSEGTQLVCLKVPNWFVWRHPIGLSEGAQLVYLKVPNWFIWRYPIGLSEGTQLVCLKVLNVGPFFFVRAEYSWTRVGILTGEHILEGDGASATGPPQMSHRLAGNQTRACTVTDGGMTVWAAVRLVWHRAMWDGTERGSYCAPNR
jgi:hypothetical protein